MMPFTRYDVSRRAWIDLTDVERTRMERRYNLRVGLMMAALSFEPIRMSNACRCHRFGGWKRP